jgi:DNA repair protein RadC
VTAFTYTHESEVITAALEIMAARCQSRKRLETPADALAYLRLKIGDSDRERFMMLTLDAQNRIIKEHEVALGTHNMVQPFPRELLGLALKDGADFVIFAHNHPSADATPSNQDCAMTAQMIPLFGACDISILDHIIVASENHYSMAVAGVLGKLHGFAEKAAMITKAMGERIVALGVD